MSSARKSGFRIAGVAATAVLAVLAMSETSARMHPSWAVSQDGDSEKVTASMRYQRMAEDALAAGDTGQAIRHYRKAIGSGGDDTNAKNGLAKALNSIGEYNEALRVLKRTDMEGNGQGLYQRGKAELATGAYTEAADSFSAAAGLLAFDADAQVGRGLAMAARGHAVDALTAFDSALNSDPDNNAALSNKALLSALIGQGEIAVDMLETLVREGRAGPRDRQNLALAYLSAGRRDDAYSMARIDLDEESVNDTFRFYHQVFGLTPEQRMLAMMTGTIAQETNMDEAANLRLNDDEGRQAAAARLTAVEPVEEEGDADLPPLLGPEGYALQIAAYRTKEQLLRGIDILYGEAGDILAGLEPRRSEVDFGDRSTYPHGFFYRLNAGPLDSLEEANEKCEQLKARGIACWVRPPEPAEGKLPD